MTPALGPWSPALARATGPAPNGPGGCRCRPLPAAASARMRRRKAPGTSGPTGGAWPRSRARTRALNRPRACTPALNKPAPLPWNQPACCFRVTGGAIGWARQGARRAPVPPLVSAWCCCRVARALLQGSAWEARAHSGSGPLWAAASVDLRRSAAERRGTVARGPGPTVDPCLAVLPLAPGRPSGVTRARGKGGGLRQGGEWATRTSTRSPRLSSQCVSKCRGALRAGQQVISKSLVSRQQGPSNSRAPTWSRWRRKPGYSARYPGTRPRYPGPRPVTRVLGPLPGYSAGRRPADPSLVRVSTARAGRC